MRLTRYLKGDLEQRSVFDVLRASGCMSVLRPWVGGEGTIFVLHRVCADGDTPLAPMFLTAGTLDTMLAAVRDAGCDILSLDDMRRRLMTGTRGRPFAVFTLDDGYLDNLSVALPVFERHRAPFCVYVCTGFIERRLDPWWAILDRLVNENLELSLAMPGVPEARWSCVTRAEKEAAYAALWDRLFPNDEQAAQIRARLYAHYGINPGVEMDRIAMTWPQVLELASHPLVTLGAHTVSHPVLPRLSEPSAREELQGGREELESRLGRPVRHVAYPFGLLGRREIRIASSLGFETATTTESGNLFPEHAGQLHCLPRRNFYENTAAPDRARAARFVRNALSGCDILVNAIRGRPRKVTEERWS